MSHPPPTARKIFNCIVDDTALIAGVKPSTRDGIRKWVSQGAIRLFVPLHTIHQLHRLKKGTDRFNMEAQEALKWLDQVTSDPAIARRVVLEGADETFRTWEEVETFMHPQTLLSMEETDTDDDDEEYSDFQDDMERSLARLDVSDGTSLSSSHSMDERPTSPQSRNDSVRRSPFKPALGGTRVVAAASPDRTAHNGADFQAPSRSEKASVPGSLRPLFNHILWRIHQETNPDAALESFILLTNDPIKQSIAQKFGVRARHLEQLRDVVAREDREFKNHQILNKLENKLESPEPRTSKSPSTEKSVPERQPTPLPGLTDDVGSDEEVILFKGVPTGPQAIQPAPAAKPVYDPNDFGRIGHNRGARGGRGRGSFAPPARGRGAPTRGRGNFAPRGAYVGPGPAFRQPPPPRATPMPDASTVLDPDAFGRPAPRINNGRGGPRALWEPN
ncbi:hypothetical protein M011DRAFT_473558 [Sporormia fimetaria CBS 119925]|uniref:PIN domain-containing protein n=1 Tax=Sporormia fimetaria CBS 119925 TaxID=1340428 RepID=A0A6A6VRB3_9PLEO|nr:hypothetical protein M011DRAFT_473558 [Sporormia fimetaria CBS 119925]